MLKWQKIGRLTMAAVAVAAVTLVVLTLRQRTPAAVNPPLRPTDPKAVLESAGGVFFRLNRDKEEIRGEYEKFLTYQDGSTKMIGVKVTTVRDGRTFVISGREGQVGDQDSNVELVGNVRAETNDGLVLTTDRATYVKAEGIAHAPGAAEFSRGRMKGSGTGFDFDNNQNILTVHDHAVVHMDADRHGAGGMDATAGGLEFRRTERLLRFERSMKATREREVLEAEAAVAHLTADEEHLEAVELRGQSRITALQASEGGLRDLTGRDIDIKYGPGGHTIEHALVVGEANLQLAGKDASSGRQISAARIDLSVASDGSTPTALAARENVKVNLPADDNGVSRVVAAQTLDSTGDASRGLTSARFADAVQFREHGATVDRAARSAVLDVSLRPGFESIEEATFTRGVRFVDGPLTATAAAARYVLASGILELTGKEAANPTPHVLNDQIIVDATRIDVTLEGPMLKATGSVKSVLQPQKKDAERKRPGDELRVPAMFKPEQPVNVTGDALQYDGKARRAAYNGNALVWQGETSIKATMLEIDSHSGDMKASGSVATVAVLVQDDKDGQRERIRSRGSSKEFAYADADRRVTYTTDAHVSGPQGDLTAARIELFLKPSGDELERVEAYDDVKLRNEERTTTGRRLTYFGDEGRYLVEGAPVKIVDTCGRETTGHTLTSYRSTGRMILDGQIRPQTKGKSNCPGT
jgi:LPS export ABC transporter protein LptC/lipopolysaccharide transport protein LptA